MTRRVHAGASLHARALTESSVGTHDWAWRTITVRQPLATTRFLCFEKPTADFPAQPSRLSRSGRRQSIAAKTTRRAPRGFQSPHRQQTHGGIDCFHHAFIRGIPASRNRHRALERTAQRRAWLSAYVREIVGVLRRENPNEKNAALASFNVAGFRAASRLKVECPAQRFFATNITARGSDGRSHAADELKGRHRTINPAPFKKRAKLHCLIICKWSSP